MLAAGRTGADVARILRVHRATISHIVAGARPFATDATSPVQGDPSESVPEQNDRLQATRTSEKLDLPIYHALRCNRARKSLK
jgi:hypothetical protein